MGEPFYVYADQRTRCADFIFPVNGDSMTPYYPDGCEVLVKKTTDRLQPDEVGVFMYADKIYLKIYQPDGLYSYNPRYKPLIFSEFEDVYLIGKALGVLEKDNIPREKDVERYKALHPEERRAVNLSKQGLPISPF